MTITLSPDQEQAVRDAIRAGKVTSVLRTHRAGDCRLAQG